MIEIHPAGLSEDIAQWYGEKVYIDGDKSNVVLVTGFLFRNGDNVQVECCWFHNGDAKSAWFPASRLSEIRE